jgi:hypothetical protein
MIGALDMIAVDDLAHVEWREPMRATVLERGDLTVRFAVEHDRLLHDGAADQLPLGKIVGPGGDVPGVAQIGAADHLLLAVGELEPCCARHRVLSVCCVGDQNTLAG